MTPAEDAPIADGFRLDGKVALVTGGGRGLGLAIAGALAAHGAAVVIAGRDEATLSAALPAVQERSPRSACRRVDVAREDSVEALAAWIVDRFDRLDILVNNAGINPYYKAAEATALSEWQEIIDVNLTGVFLCCRVFGGHMLAQEAGSIINVTSIAGHVGLPKSAAYCAAKGGVELLTRSLALDWAPRGVRVNALAPGYFETDLTAGMRGHPVLGERVRGKTPLGRFGTPDELTGAAVFLASGREPLRHGAVDRRRWGLDSRLKRHGNSRCPITRQNVAIWTGPSFITGSPLNYVSIGRGRE